MNATFAPIYNSAAISQVVGNQSYIAPFPSFNFEDLGLNLKATPIIHSNTDVSLKIELNIRTSRRSDRQWNSDHSEPRVHRKHHAEE